MSECTKIQLLNSTIGFRGTDGPKFQSMSHHSWCCADNSSGVELSPGSWSLGWLDKAWPQMESGGLDQLCPMRI